MAASTVLIKAQKIVYNDGSTDHDISSFVQEMAVQRERESQDRTAVDDLHEDFDIGVFSDAITNLKMFQDYAAGGPHAVFGKATRKGEAGTLKWNPTNDATSVTNPQYSLPVYVASMSLPGNFGEQAMVEVSFLTRGDRAKATS